MSTSILENTKRLVRATADGYNAWDYDALRATRSDDFVYQFLPSTLHAPARNNAECKVYWDEHMTSTFKKFQVTLTSVTHDPETRTSVVFATSDLETAAGAERIEIVLRMRFDEGAERVVRVDEFFDSLAFTDIFARASAALAGGAGKA